MLIIRQKPWQSLSDIEMGTLKVGGVMKGEISENGLNIRTEVLLSCTFI